MQKITEIAHQLQGTPQGIAVDATCGNGFDTVFGEPCRAKEQFTHMILCIAIERTRLAADRTTNIEYH